MSAAEAPVPTVDMIVAVHDVRRNIRRAIGSILADGDPTIRALVVCHNLPEQTVADELVDLRALHGERLRLVELNDGIPSPSGPFNFGIETSTADYVGIMGSDDELDRDAISQWRAQAERHRADAVIAKVVRGSQRTLVRSPPKRIWRTGVLDFARDRLSYRSAPLGVMRRESVARLGLHLLDGARNGGDLPFVTRLWLTGRVVAATGLAAYVEHADAPVRVTYVAKPVREELSAVLATFEDEKVRAMTPPQRLAFATKLLRRNLTDSVRKRDAGRAFSDDDRAVMAEFLALIDDFAPAARHMLSPAQFRMFDEFMRERPDAEAIAAADAASSRYRSYDALAPARLRHVLHPQAQPRFMASTALIKVGASRYFPAFRAAVLSAAAVVVALVLALIFWPR